MDLLDYLHNTSNVLRQGRLLAEDDVFTNGINHIASYLLKDNLSYIEVYTNTVFPRLITVSDENSKDFLIWDEHIWDLYGHHLIMKGLLHYSQNHGHKGREIPQSAFIRYYRSMMFAYLACRFNGNQALAYQLAKEYALVAGYKFPQYDQSEDVLSNLEKADCKDAFELVRLFCFGHELAHAAFRKNDENTNEVKEIVVDTINDSISLLREMRELKKLAGVSYSDYDKAIVSLEKCANSLNSKLVEEISCDILSILALQDFLEDNDSQGIINANTAKYPHILDFYIFMTWLTHSEMSLKRTYQDYEKKLNEAQLASDLSAIFEKTDYRFNLFESDNGARMIVVCQVLRLLKIEAPSLLNFDTLLRKEKLLLQIFSLAQGDNLFEDIVLQALARPKGTFHLQRYHKKKNKLLGWIDK